MTACTPSSPASSSASQRTCTSSAPTRTGSERMSRCSVRTARRCTRRGLRCHSRASGRWPAFATTSPRSSCGRSHPEWDVALRLRNWAYESAALDLALRQSGRSLHDLLGLEPQPVRFVNSLGLGKEPSIEPVRRRLARSPVCASSSTRRRPGRRTSSTKSRRPARSTRSTSRASTASRSRIRRR